MNNPLLSAVICLDENSCDIGYYDTFLQDFASGFGYHIQVDGKPFKYPHIKEFFDICKQNNIEGIGVRVEEFDTNDMNMLLRQEIRSVMLRLQSLDDAKNERIMGKKYFRVDLINDIERLTSCGINIELSVVLCKENYGEIDEIIQFCIDHKVQLLVLERNIIAKYRNYKCEDISSLQYRDLIKKVINYNNRCSGNFGIAVSHCPNKILFHKDEGRSELLGGCSAGIISCAIGTDGNIIPCLPLHELSLGNIKNSDIKKVWSENEILKTLRDRKLLEGKCGKCIYAISCGGCRAESFVRDSRLMGEDITCWEEVF